MGQSGPETRVLVVDADARSLELLDGHPVLGRDPAERLARLDDVLSSIGEVRNQRTPTEQARQDQHGEHESNDLSRHESSRLMQPGQV